MSDPQTEEKILEAAIEVFLEKGFDGARTQDIANRAGFNKALVHYYYRSKHKLYRESFRRLFGHFIKRILSQTGEPDSLMEFLQRFTSAYMDTIYREPKIIPFLLWELQRDSGFMGSLIHQELSSKAEGELPLAKVIRQAAERGELGDLDPVQTTLSVLGLIIFPIVGKPLLEKIFPGLDISSEQFREDRKAFLHKFLRYGLNCREAHHAED